VGDRSWVVAACLLQWNSGMRRHLRCLAGLAGRSWPRPWPPVRFRFRFRTTGWLPEFTSGVPDSGSGSDCQVRTKETLGARSSGKVTVE
jgi:hypothetical protein